MPPVAARAADGGTAAAGCISGVVGVGRRPRSPPRMLEGKGDGPGPGVGKGPGMMGDGLNPVGGGGPMTGWDGGGLGVGMGIDTLGLIGPGMGAGLPMGGVSR